MPTVPSDWNRRYQEGDTPWDSGLPSRELGRVLADESLRPGRALELGCGTGTNAVFLAQQGFEVTAIDLSELALKQAQQRAERAGRVIRFLQADVCNFPWQGEPFDFVFDRGCYHCARRIDLPGFLETLRKVTKPGSLYLVLTGNANEQSDEGPPRLHEHEIRAELGELFDVNGIREFRFQDAGGVDGPLGWSCLLTRR